MLSSTSSLRSVVLRSNSLRAFTTCEPALRLKGIFEGYRQKNYSREMPSRFKKELIKAACPSGSAIQIDSLNQILVNIGHAEDRLSESELSMLLQEAGLDDEHRAVPVEKIFQLI